jgi:hypothetical protein
MQFYILHEIQLSGKTEDNLTDYYSSQKIITNLTINKLT